MSGSRRRATGGAVAELVRSLLDDTPHEKRIETLLNFGFQNPETALSNFLTLRDDPLSGWNFARLVPNFLDRLAACPARDAALNNFERFSTNVSSRSTLFSLLFGIPGALDLALTVFSSSQSLSETLIRNPEYFDWLLDPHVIAKTWTSDDFRAEIIPVLGTLRYWDAQLNALRRYKRRMMLRIGLRDMKDMADFEETTRDLSYLADVCLDAAYRLSKEDMNRRFGDSGSEEPGAAPAQFAVLGMGKLGGLELNYSSDIDVIFVYSGEGRTSGGSDGSIENHIYFTRLAEKMLQVLSKRTREHYLYRVDTRLRPEGETGPLVRSLQSYENYYASLGQHWERQALIKARFCAGEPQVAERFLAGMTPFVYRKYLDYTALGELRAIKARIDGVLDQKGQLQTHVKLGVGGIREAEFGIQILQLLYAGKLTSLRERSSLAALKKLAREKIIEGVLADRLSEAYVFLRRVEHWLQIEHELQAHVLPEDPEKLTLLARRMGFASAAPFMSALEETRKIVYEFFHNVLSALARDETGRSGPLRRSIETAVPDEAEGELLRSLGVDDIESAARRLSSMAARGRESADPEFRKDFDAVVERLIISLPKALDADQALVGLDRFVSAYQAGRSFFSILRHAPRVVDLLVMVMGGSPFLTEILVRHPEFFDVLTAGALETAGLDEERHSRMVRRLHEDYPPEDQIRFVREYMDFEMLKTGARDLLGLFDCLKVIHQLSALARVVLTDIYVRAVEGFRKKHSSPPAFAIMGLGKFGGAELSYVSDLDLVFITEGDIESVERANMLGSSLIEMLSRNTAAGYLYKVDPRLRPDGSKGPLVQAIETCRDYYGASDALWERMALTRACFVAGDERLGSDMTSMVKRFVFSNRIRPDQVVEIRDIRERIYQERCAQAPDGYDVKSGIGGLLDIEFLAQFLLVKCGSEGADLWEPNTLKLLQKLVALNAVPREDASLLMDAYMFFRQIENALRLLKDRSTDWMPRDERWALRIQKKLGLEPDPERFFERLERTTRLTRYLFNKVVI